MKTCIFTIVAKNYLPYAHCLMRSAKRHFPDARRLVFLCDRLDDGDRYLTDDFELISVETLDIPKFASMALRYSVIELCTAVKPSCAQFLLQEFDKAIYFDPDIKLFTAPETVVEQLDDQDIVLTPHLLAPVSDDFLPSEINISRVGTYNLGFIGLRRSQNTANFLDWWQRHLASSCIVAPDRGLFVDQKWIDLVPGLFENVTISRDQALNVAYWNLAQREITKRSGKLFVGDTPLICFHFSGIDVENSTFSKHQNRFSLESLPATVREISAEYISEMKNISEELELPDKQYAFAHFHDQQALSPVAKKACQKAFEKLTNDADRTSSVSATIPKRVISDCRASSEKVISLLNQPSPHPQQLKLNPLVTRLVYEAYVSRVELQYRYPDLFGRDAVAFCQWLVASNSSSHELPTQAIEHIQRQLGQKYKSHSRIVSLYHKFPIIRSLALRLTTHRFRTRLSKLFSGD